MDVKTFFVVVPTITYRLLEPSAITLRRRAT